MVPNQFNKLLNNFEREQLQVLEYKIRNAKTVAEIDAYRDQMGLIMSSLVRRYRIQYRNKDENVQKMKEEPILPKLK